MQTVWMVFATQVIVRFLYFFPRSGARDLENLVWIQYLAFTCLELIEKFVVGGILDVMVLGLFGEEGDSGASGNSKLSGWTVEWHRPSSMGLKSSCD